MSNNNSHLNRSKGNKYLKLLNNFDKIPECRKSVNEQNLLWFIRNGAMLNSGHKDFFEALNLARELLNNNNNNSNFK